MIIFPKKISFICEPEGENSVFNFVSTLYKDFNFLGDIKRPYRSSDIIEVMVTFKRHFIRNNYLITSNQ